MNKWCSMQIEILMWYGLCVNEFNDGDFRHPQIQVHIDDFCDNLKLLKRIEKTRHGATYETTDLGDRFVDKILNLELPA